MPVTSVATDPASLTLSIVAEFTVDRERLWQAFTDPRQLERFWGPPTWPASFGPIDPTPGATAAYHMTGPEGQVAGGVWEFLDVDPPHGFTVLDHFARPDGSIDTDLPTVRLQLRFEATATGSRATCITTFASVEAMDTVVEMGVTEGMRLAFGQMDLVLADLADLAAAGPGDAELLDATSVRIARVVRGPLELVWPALTEPASIRKWMLGPDGWSMPVCEFEAVAGARYRWVWEPDAGTDGEAFGFHGEVLLVDPPHRLVTTESMIGDDSGTAINDLSCHAEGGLTLVTYVITYPDQTSRDAVLATGMNEGLQASFDRLERLVATG